MDYCNFIFWQRECLYDLFVAFFEVLVIQLFAFENKRIHYKNLPSKGNLIPHELMESHSLVLAELIGYYGLSPGRHLVDYRYVEISVKCHCECSRNRRCRHYKYMRGNSSGSFIP